MPLAMGLAVVATANHYLIDVIVGGIVAMAGLALATLLMRACEPRAREPSAERFGAGMTWSTRHC